MYRVLGNDLHKNLTLMPKEKTARPLVRLYCLFIVQRVIRTYELMEKLPEDLTVNLIFK